MKNYRLVQWDSFKLIKKEKDWSLNLIITSPPYNIWKSYETKTNLEEYLNPYRNFAKDCFDKLSNNWSLCWEVGNFVKNWEVYPLDIFFYEIFKSVGFHLRNRIIWHFEHWLHSKNRLSWRYETILWFTKTDNYVFNLDPIRVPSKYPGKLHYKWDKKWQPSWNPLWKNPSDFWKTIEEDRNTLLWDIPNVKSNHPEKTIHPCQFPIELIQRCVLALTNEWDSILDPFAWVWSTLIASLLHNRKAIGYEMMQEYIECTKDRIKSLEEWTLKIRPLWKPVYQPTWKEKISQVPKEWGNDNIYNK